MSPLRALLLVTTAFLTGARMPRREPPVLVPNANTAPAGTLRNGVLTIELDATLARWHREGGTPSIKVAEAFGERGKTPTMPGPLVRVQAGTEVRFSVRNTLTRPITFFAPKSISTDDSIVVGAGATAELRTRAVKPGSFVYRATTADQASSQLRITGALAGAFVVDTAGVPAPRDRIMMILMTPDSALITAANTDNIITSTAGVFGFTINGRSWPNTDRISATVGDTVHWRVINASADVHPMHLHGFYFRVDDFDGPFADRDGQRVPGRMVVTERMANFSSMSMSWVPERPGNWLFHCHFALHLVPPGAPDTMAHDANHALTGMVGLVVGISVAPRDTRPVVTQTSERRLRLVAVRDSGFPDAAASMRFVLDEGGRRTEARTAFSPTLYLARNEPVAIMVVNTLREPTSVHWHGIELESYYDGVGGLSGTANRLAPVIAPGDSFLARFTPPRAGTFMYHSHFDDTRQQPAGLAGALIVRDLQLGPVRDDHEFFIKGARAGSGAASPLEINGVANPDTLVFRVGRPQRLRFMSLAAVNPNATVTLTSRPDSSFANLRDTMLVQWRPVAKDGADLLEAARVPRRAQQIVSMGETYDFEFTPTRPGLLRIEVRGAGARASLFIRVPIRVE